MTISTYLTIVASTVLATACATNNAQKNQYITKNGLIYIEQVDSLLTETLDVIIDVDSTELWRSRPHSPKKSRKKVMLHEKNHETTKLTYEIAEFRKGNANTKRYFLALEALINDPARQSIANTIGDASTAIAREQHRRANNSRFYTDSYDREGSISKLSHIAVNAHYSKRIQDILRKDAAIIGPHLDSQEAQLKNIVSILKDRMKTAELLYLIINIEKPYLGNQPLPLGTWKANRREWFEMQQAAPALDDLIQAQLDVRKAWDRVLFGDNKVTSVSHMLNDTSKITQSIGSFTNAPQSLSY
ncbi:hypothetical protein [Leucothrix arctica]|uniref:Uncharacterized protein n=1 Tax=Leucothrix arctica TaxID=1481894 RepID=A0A317C870_9GAMM|nr:hypothetical protein [Leucothrix arctica]PWQ94855.1 hypothetical protein DKT75_13970 [Leucothrix arctica]